MFGECTLVFLPALCFALPLRTRDQSRMPGTGSCKAFALLLLPSVDWAAPAMISCAALLLSLRVATSTAKAWMWASSSLISLSLENSSSDSVLERQRTRPSDPSFSLTSLTTALMRLRQWFSWPFADCFGAMAVWARMSYFQGYAEM